MPRALDIEFISSLPFCMGDRLKMRAPIYLIFVGYKINIIDYMLDNFNYYEYILLRISILR
jgi:hypothetical protein